MKRTLRIAVDARPLTHPMAGITRYTYELISRLVHSPHQWFLYLDREPIHPIPTLANVHVRYNTIHNRWLGTLFSQYVFPIWARHDDIDVFWSPRHHLPLLLPKRVKTLLTIHDLVWKHYPKTMPFFQCKLESQLMPRSIKNADRVITPAKAITTELQQFFPHAENKTTAIYSGLTHIKENTATPLATTQQYFLFVGTLEPRKNIPVLIKAFATFSEKNNHIRLVIVGGQGWGNQNLARLINTLGLHKKIDLIGRVTDEELAAYYRNSIALLYPSMYEGFGFPIVESMSYGVPVICSDRGAMKEISGEAGLLIDPESIDNIVNAMEKMLDNTIRTQYSLQAKKQSKLFDWNKASELILSEIENMCLAH